MNTVAIDPTTSPHTIIVGSDAGVLSSQNNGATWQALGTGLPVVEVTSVNLDPTSNPPLLRAGTYGRSVFQLMRAPATVPGAPSNAHATAGNGSAALTWSAPASNGGRAISGYVITPYVGGVPQPSRAVGPGASATVTGLTNGLLYTFRVSAVNAIGAGPPSTASNGVTPAGVPAAPLRDGRGRARDGHLERAGLEWRQRDHGLQRHSALGRALVRPDRSRKRDLRRDQQPHEREELHVHRHRDEPRRHRAAVRGLEPGRAETLEAGGLRRPQRRRASARKGEALDQGGALPRRQDHPEAFGAREEGPCPLAEAEAAHTPPGRRTGLAGRRPLRAQQRECREESTLS